MAQHSHPTSQTEQANGGQSGHVRIILPGRCHMLLFNEQLFYELISLPKELNIYCCFFLSLR